MADTGCQRSHKKKPLFFFSPRDFDTPEVLTTGKMTRGCFPMFLALKVPKTHACEVRALLKFRACRNDERWRDVEFTDIGEDVAVNRYLHDPSFLHLHLKATQRLYPQRKMLRELDQGFLVLFREGGIAFHFLELEQSISEGHVVYRAVVGKERVLIRRVEYFLRKTYMVGHRDNTVKVTLAYAGDWGEREKKPRRRY